MTVSAAAPKSLSPSLSRPITVPITRRRRWGHRPSRTNAYIVRVNDDGYPVREGSDHQGDRPRVIAFPRWAETPPPESPKHREGRIRYHQWRVAQRL
jgi:hypothetical protein